MPLIVDHVDSQKPQTHVMVVGIDTYPYLKGGKKSGQGITIRMGLGQLTTPVRSATNVADFFARQYLNPNAELGSLAVLLSSRKYAPSGQQSRPVDDGTFANVRTYFREWADRLDQHEDSIGVFYFCGHGIEPSGLLLLPQDFGADAGDPWSSAIHFTASYSNLAQIKARTQLFLIDACRKAPTDAKDAALNMAKGSGSLGRPLFGIVPGRVFHERAAPLVMAAPLGQEAYAPRGGLEGSYFAKAVVDCFARAGAERFDGQEWIVTTDSLGRSMKERLSRIRLPNGGTAACSVGGTSNFTVDLHRFTGPASVLCRVTANPAAALAQATLELADSINPPHRRGPSPEPWEDEVQTDANSTWQLTAQLPASAAWTTKVMTGLRALPPIFTPTVRWP